MTTSDALLFVDTNKRQWESLGWLETGSIADSQNRSMAAAASEMVCPVFSRVDVTWFPDIPSNQRSTSLR
jgi:hypothetical protein